MPRLKCVLLSFLLCFKISCFKSEILTGAGTGLSQQLPVPHHRRGRRRLRRRRADPAQSRKAAEARQGELPMKDFQPRLFF